MLPAERDDLTLAIVLVALAGFVDAVGFLVLGGLFVSFMSGNSTQIAILAGGASWPAAAPAGAIVGAFVAGIVAGRLVGTWAGTWRRPALRASRRHCSVAPPPSARRCSPQAR